MNEQIVGHMTFLTPDGYRHKPLYQSEVDALCKRLEDLEQKRATPMLDEASAIRLLFDAWLRLKELGWNDAIYCPKDGTPFKVIELGSTGIHSCNYDNGRWYIYAEGDIWPSRPILYKP